MESCVIVAIAFFLILIFAGGSSSAPKEKDLPTHAHAKCPFCGKDNPSRAYIPSKEPVPAIFRCADCWRYYGDTAAMTPEERNQVKQSNNDCARVDRMPEKAAVIDAVVSYFKSARSYNSDGDLGMVAIKDGYVEVKKAKGGNSVIAHYPKISGIADQRLTLMCYDRVRKEMPYKDFSFGDRWVCEEKHRH